MLKNFEIDVKKRIIEILREYPEGLNIKKISEIARLNRHTISKYVLALKEARLIKQEEFGRAKICILIKK